MTYVIGLTGGIGSGKTMVSDHFESLGVPVIDTDIIAREIVELGEPALEQLTGAFGKEILLADGTLNRSALRSLAFANKENKALLDSITHPAIGTRTVQQIAKVDFQYCILVVPLLKPSSKFIELMQRILVVTAEHETKLLRVAKRSGLSHKETERIMSTQLSDEERLDFADDIIANDGTIKEAQSRVEELHQQYLSLIPK